ELQFGIFALHPLALLLLPLLFFSMSPTTRGQVRELQALQAETGLTEERELAQISASRSGSSPLKAGGSTDLGHDKATRADVETLLAEEIHDRRSKSGDL
ncbi:hypothetical protein C8R47DRAFT_1112578, partial [Mycena vitilis]